MGRQFGKRLGGLGLSRGQGKTRAGVAVVADDPAPVDEIATGHHEIGVRMLTVDGLDVRFQPLAGHQAVKGLARKGEVRIGEMLEQNSRCP